MGLNKKNGGQTLMKKTRLLALVLALVMVVTLFAACGESIGYVPQDDLIFSKAEPEGYEAPIVQVCVIVPPEKTAAAI